MLIGGLRLCVVGLVLGCLFACCFGWVVCGLLVWFGACAIISFNSVVLDGGLLICLFWAISYFVD